VCATIRKEIDKTYFLKNERNWATLKANDLTGLAALTRKQMQDVVTKVAVLFVKVIHLRDPLNSLTNKKLCDFI
jgi:hypothetical protein